MACVAAHVLVSTGQRKLCLPVMVEAPEWPAVRVVAAVALRSELSGMVRILMTSGARRWRVTERLVPVALLASDCGVEPNQRKARQIMVERDLLPPFHFVVTAFAAGP